MRLGLIAIIYFSLTLSVFSATFHDLSECKIQNYFVQNTKRIAVVAHGFNNLPSEMDSIIRDLNLNQISVIRICLKGHGLNDPEFKNVRASDWIYNVENAIELAVQVASQLQREKNIRTIPVDFLGFSLGALIFENISIKLKSVIDKKIFLSPALILKIKSMDSLKKLDSAYWLPSFTPAKYRANRKTRFAAYKSMFDLVDGFNRFKLQNTKTLIFVNPKDELIKVKKIKQMIESQNLNQWILKDVHRDSRSRYKINHLIVDEQSLGINEYKKMIAQIIDFIIY